VRAPRPPSDKQARSLFEGWLSASEAGVQCGWSEFVQAHPTVTPELERLRSDYERARAALAYMASEPIGGAQEPEPESLAPALAAFGRPREPDSYALLGILARGGMGVIEQVWDTRLRRPLARKLVPIPVQGPHTPAERRRLGRFLQEALVSSQLHHPGILPIHDLGTDVNGHPFFTMPVVRGTHFGSVIREVHRGENGWNLPRALRVIVDVCEVVACAHSKGVVHRDLKPQNLMVGRFGETFVMDWGVAKVIDREAREDEPPATIAGSDMLESLAAKLAVGTCDPVGTLQGDVVGTPAYMPPEQANGELERMGPAVDQYSIGAILYEVLANRAPYSDIPETDTPERLIATVRHAPPTPLERLVPRAPSELVAICNKAMHRDPTRRYASVEALGADLRAFLELRVVSAYDAGPMASLGKWIRRNRGVAAMMILVALVIAGGLAVFLALEKHRGHLLAAANVALERAQLDHASKVEDLRREAYLNDLAFAQRALATGVDGGDVQRVLDSCADDLRGWEWRFLRSQADQSTRVSSEYGAVAVSSDGRYVAACTRDYEVVLRELDGGHEVCRIACRATVDSVAISPDNRWLAVAARDQLVYVMEIESGTLRETFVGAGNFNLLAFTPDARELLTRTGGTELTILALGADIRRPGVRTTAGITALATHATGRVALGDSRGTVSVFEEPDGELLAELHLSARAITQAAFQAEDLIVASDLDGRVWLHDLAASSTRRIDPREGRVPLLNGGCAFDARSERWACATATSIELLELSSGRWQVFHGHTGNVQRLAFTADGRLVSTGDDATTRLWTPRGHAFLRQVRDLGGAVAAVSVAPDRSSVAAAVGSRIVRLALDSLGRTEVEAQLGRIRRLRHLGAEGQIVAVGDYRCLRFFDQDELRLARNLYVEVAQSNVLALAHDGTLLTGADPPAWDNMYLWDLRPGGGARPFTVPYLPLDGCFSPDGTSFALVADDGCLHLFDTATRAERSRIVLSDLSTHSVAWSPDGTVVAVGGTTARQGWPIFLIDSSAGAVHGELTGPRSALALRFTADGRLLSGQDKAVRVWEPASRRSLLEIALDTEGSLSTMDLSADGSVLAVGTSAGEVFVWQLDR
jgi:serine/threonine protein kinase/WD40 repeat protein